MCWSIARKDALNWNGEICRKGILQNKTPSIKDLSFEIFSFWHSISNSSPRARTTGSSFNMPLVLMLLIQFSTFFVMTVQLPKNINPKVMKLKLWSMIKQNITAIIFWSLLWQRWMILACSASLSDVESRCEITCTLDDDDDDDIDDNYRVLF